MFRANKKIIIEKKSTEAKGKKQRGKKTKEKEDNLKKSQARQYSLQVLNDETCAQ